MRQALNLPPANRPALGKGPTGKDKPKSFDGHSQSLQSSRDSSSPDSPSSTRTSSLSPSALTAPMPSRPVQVLDSGPWDQPIIMNEQPSDVPGPSASPTYQLPPMSAPLPSKSMHYPYTNSLPPSSRPSIANNMYMVPQPSYPHSSADRPMGSAYGSQAFLLRGDVRDEPRQQYSYEQSSFQSHDSNMHSQSPPASAPPAHSQSPLSQRESSSALPYPHRRSLTEPQGFSIGQGFPHLPTPVQAPHSIRLPSPRLQDSGGHSHPPPRSTYGPDGRLNSMT